VLSKNGAKLETSWCTLSATVDTQTHPSGDEETDTNATSSSATAERPRCTVGQLWPKL